MHLGYHCLVDQFASGAWKAFHRRAESPIPVERLSIGPHSIDVSLSGVYLVPEPRGTVDPFRPETLNWTVYDQDTFIVPSLGFVLSSVNERFVCTAPRRKWGLWRQHYAQMYDGRSTLGRLGQATHITAGYGDYGFEGAFTLEIFNHLPVPVALHRDMRVGQVFFVEVDSPSLYVGNYSNDLHHKFPMPPRLGIERLLAAYRPNTPSQEADIPGTSRVTRPPDLLALTPTDFFKSEKESK